MDNKVEKKRDEVLKRMLNTPPESNTDMAKRKRVDKHKAKALKNKR